MALLVRTALRRLASRVTARSRPWRARALPRRLGAALLAAVVCLGSVVPDLGSCRCLTTGQRMSRACCPDVADTMNGAAASSEGGPVAATISQRCCELVPPVITEPVTPPERAPG